MPTTPKSVHHGFDMHNHSIDNVLFEYKSTVEVGAQAKNYKTYVVNKSIYDNDIYGNGNKALLIHHEDGDLLLFHLNYNQIKPPTADISIADSSGDTAYTIRDVLVDSTDNTSVATVGYVKSLINNDNWEWFTDVISKLVNPPATPSNGDRYLIVGSTPSGAWEGHMNDIAEWNSSTSSWTFETPTIDNAVRTTDDGHTHLFATLNSLDQWVDLGGMFSYYGGTAINIDGTNINWVSKTDGGLNSDAYGAYIDFVAPFYVNASHKFAFNYSTSHFALGDGGVFIPLQLTTATAPLIPTYDSETHLTNIALSFAFPLYKNTSGQLDIKVYELGGIICDPVEGYKLNLKSGGGILLDPATGEAYIDPTIAPTEHIEVFTISSATDHLFTLPSTFTNSASATFEVEERVGSTTEYVGTSLDIRRYTGSRDVLVKVDEDMIGTTFRIVCRG